MALKILLSLLGRLMALAARCSRHFRAQCTRDIVVEIGSEDGVAHHFVFGRRRMASRRGPAADPELTLTFATAGTGFRALATPWAVRLIVDALLARRATVRGNPSLLLWFYGLTRVVLPLGREHRDREPLPGSFLVPNPASKVADRITRLPVADALDPAWAAGVTAHQKMAMPRASSGERIPLW